MPFGGDWTPQSSSHKGSQDALGISQHSMSCSSQTSEVVKSLYSAGYYPINWWGPDFCCHFVVAGGTFTNNEQILLGLACKSGYWYWRIIITGPFLKYWVALSREWWNGILHSYDGDSFPHSLLRTSQNRDGYFSILLHNLGSRKIT